MKRQAPTTTRKDTFRKARHIVVALALASVSAIAGGFLAPESAAAQTTTTAGAEQTGQVVPVQLGLDSRIWVEGTSTVQDFSCEAGVVAGTIRARAGEDALSLERLESAVTRAEVLIPAGQMDCSNGTMNDHMWKALKSEDHPNIRFTLRNYRVTGTSEGSATVELTGVLSLAGVTRTRTITAVATPLPDGSLEVTGTTRFNQTEHEMKPPSLMFGVLKVHDPVEVGFDLILDPQRPGGSDGGSE